MARGWRTPLLPKFTVPQVSEHASGPASRTASRAPKPSVTAPPVDSWTIRPVPSRSAWTVSVSLPRSRVGRAFSSLICTWMTAAPATLHVFAVVTSSSSVTGSAGTDALSDSAPVGATVMSGPAGRPVRFVVMSGRMPFRTCLTWENRPREASVHGRTAIEAYTAAAAREPQHTTADDHLIPLTGRRSRASSSGKPTDQMADLGASLAITAYSRLMLSAFCPACGALSSSQARGDAASGHGPSEVIRQV
jgi:hypothetical protein